MEQIDLRAAEPNKPDTNAVPPGGKYIVVLLVLLFGLGSWFAVTCILSQIPIIAIGPDDLQMPTKLWLTTLIGNGASFLYVRTYVKIARPLNDAHAICMVMAVGCVAAICLPFTYQITVSDVHIALHGFLFLFGAMGGFSSILFMPYMKRYRGNYLYIFLLGQALNDVLSNVLAAIQGMWSLDECVMRENLCKRMVSPLFPPKVAFMFVFPVLAMSTAAFICLNKLQVCRVEVSADAETKPAQAEPGISEREQQETSTNVPIELRLREIQVYIASMEMAIGAMGIFPLIHSYTGQQYERRPQTYIVAVALIAVYKPLVWCIVTLKSQECMRIVRGCAPRVLVFAPYVILLFFLLMLWLWPLHSLLGLILLVSVLNNSNSASICHRMPSNVCLFYSTVHMLYNTDR